MKNIPLFKVYMNPSVGTKVAEVLNSGYIGQGPKVEEFEQKINSYFGADNILTVNSGTSALHLAIHLHRDKWNYGDEVLATPLTCTASNWPILAHGLKIKWVDIDPTTLNMDLDDLARKISPKTKLIMGVHWGGYPLDLDKIRLIQDWAKGKFGFRPELIEDAAHAIGTKYKGKYLGSHGNIVINSLQAIKHLTAVDGGLIHLPNRELYDRAKLVRWFGIDRETNTKDFRCEADILEWGYKFHMNDVNATVGIENLKHLDYVLHSHTSNASYYDDELKNVNGVTLLKREDGYDSTFWIYSMLVDDRDGFYKHMKKCGIMASQVHERNDKHSCVSEFKTELPILEKTIGKVVSIPVGWWLSDDDLDYIVDCIKKGW